MHVVYRHRALFGTLGVGSLLISTTRSSRQVLLPLWGEHIGLDPVTVSVLFGLSGAAEMLMVYPGGSAMDRIGRRWVGVVTMTGMAASLSALPLTTSAGSLAIVAVSLGIANGFGSGINITIGTDASPAIGRSAFLGVWRLCSDVGTGLGPVTVSAVSAATALGPAALVIGAAAASGAVILYRWVPPPARPVPT